MLNEHNSDNMSCDKKLKIKKRFLTVLNLVPMDPVIDPEFGKCFHCWRFGHTYQNCPNPKINKFCYNCGRKGEKVDTCPRCHVAYRDYQKKRLKETSQNPIQNYSDDPTQYEKNNQGTKDESQFYKIPKYKIENNEIEEEYFSCEEDENYENLVVDENQKSSHVTSDLLKDLLNLIEVIKYFPIETQNTILAHFMLECYNSKEAKSKMLSEACIRNAKNFFNCLKGTYFLKVHCLHIIL